MGITAQRNWTPLLLLTQASSAILFALCYHGLTNMFNPCNYTEIALAIQLASSVVVATLSCGMLSATFLIDRITSRKMTSRVARLLSQAVAAGFILIGVFGVFGTFRIYEYLDLVKSSPTNVKYDEAELSVQFVYGWANYAVRFVAGCLLASIMVAIATNNSSTDDPKLRDSVAGRLAVFVGGVLNVTSAFAICIMVIETTLQIGTHPLDYTITSRLAHQMAIFSIPTYSIYIGFGLMGIGALAPALPWQKQLP